MAKTQEVSTQNLKTPEVTLSYPSLDRPSKYDEGSKERYQAALVVTAEAQKTPEFKALRQAIAAVAKSAFGDKWQEVLKGMQHPPFRSGEGKGYPEGSVFMHPKSKFRPGVVSRFLDPATGKARVIEPDSEEWDLKVWPGVIVRALVTPYPVMEKNKGVYLALGGVQIMEDPKTGKPRGERLDSIVSAPDAFDATEAPTADLSDLTGEGEAAGATEEDDDLPF